MQRLLAGRKQLAAVGEAFVFFINLLEFTRLRRKFVQLFQLILQQFAARFALLHLLLMLRQRAAALMPLTIVSRHALHQQRLIGVGVKQGFLMFRLQQ